MKKILIFGACGFVGRYLVNDFLANGYSVVGSDISQEAKDLSCPYFSGDITNADSVSSIVCAVRPDYIVNLAAISSVALSWKIPHETFSVNVLGIINILEALISSSLFKTKILVVGSSEEYLPKASPLSVNDPLDSNNPYGVSKTTQEQLSDIYCQKYGFSIIRVRAFNHTGIGQKDSFVIPSFCKQVAAIEKSKKPGVIFVGNLSVVRDFSDVRDVVSCYRWLLENKDSGVFNVGSGNPHSLEEILKMIISFSSQKIAIVHDPSKMRFADTPFVCCKKDEVPIAFTHPIEETLKEIYSFYVNS